MSRTIKLWVDDIRPVPDESWIRATNYWEAMDMLTNNWYDLSVVSLDHDISSFRDGREYTGYDILCKIEEKAYFTHPEFEIRVHSMNPVGAGRMRKLISFLKERREQNYVHPSKPALSKVYHQDPDTAKKFITTLVKEYALLCTDPTRCVPSKILEYFETKEDVHHSIGEFLQSRTVNNFWSVLKFLLEWAVDGNFYFFSQEDIDLIRKW